jgi:hypothetical protein
MSEEQPQGVTTPVKPFEAQTETEQPGFASAAPKDNTLLYVGGSALLLSGIYLATKK